MIFNTLGRRVKTIVSKTQAAGHYKVVWNGKDESSVPVSAGMYLVRLKAGSHTSVRKLLLVK